MGRGCGTPSVPEDEHRSILALRFREYVEDSREDRGVDLCEPVLESLEVLGEIALGVQDLLPDVDDFGTFGL